MATAFQPAPHWNRAVPLSQEQSALFDPSYPFDADQPPREKSDHAKIRPSQYSTTLRVDPQQMEYMKRDSGRSLKSAGSASRSTSPLKVTPDGIRRPSAAISIPRSESQGTLEDEEAWIHRDKLARIESQEMAAAGFALPQSTRRRRDRSTASRNQSVDRLGNPNHATREGKMNAVGGASDDQESDDYEERLQEEPRLDQQMYSKSLPKSSLSRIPVARASPAPLSPSVVDRDTPLPRNKHANTSVTSRLSTSSRTRSRSLGNPSMMMAELNDSESTAASRARPRSSHLQDPSNIPNSPSLSVSSKTPSLTSAAKGKTSTSVATGSVNRKGTGPKSASKIQSSSVSSKNNTPSRRPTTSSSKPRPTSLTRPEGDAPWLAHMYKPDPMLPPDQQLLPTHAKRMVNGQSSDIKASPDSFTKDFDALDDEELARMGALPPSGPVHTLDNASPNQAPGQLPWPVTSNISETKSNSGSLPHRASSVYKITPTIESPKPSLRPVQAETPRASYQPPVQRVPDPDEKADGKKKKKFACCVMM